MNVIVPVAGRGTRLRPLTLHRPKPLLHVGGDTLLAHALAPLRRLPVRSWVFIVGYLGDEIRRYVDRSGLAAEYVTQPEPLGQAHALSLAGHWLDGPVLVVFPDMLFEADLRDMSATGNTGNTGGNDTDGSDADGFVFARRVADPRRFGVVTTDADGFATAFHEKPVEPVSDRAVVGLYYVRDGAWLRSAVDELLATDQRTRGEFYLADALELMIRAGARIRVRNVTVWEDCGTIEDMLATNRFLLERLDAIGQEPELEDVVIRPPVRIESGACVRGSTVGPYAFIGPGCHLEGSVVGPHVSLEGDCRVSDSHLDDCVVGNGAVLDRAAVSSSLLGANVDLRGVRIETYLGDYSRVHAGRTE